MRSPEGVTPANQTRMYEGYAYTLRVATGSVSLATRQRIATLSINDGVRTYDEAALGKFGRATSRQSALSGRMLKHQEGLMQNEQLDYTDDLYLASSPAAVDRWLAGAYRALGRATVAVLLFQSMADRYDDLVAQSTFGGETMLAAADELDRMVVELEALRSGIPAIRSKTVTTQIIDAVHSITRAKANYRAAAGVMTTLSDVRRNIKALYYPSGNGTLIEK